MSRSLNIAIPLGRSPGSAEVGCVGLCCVSGGEARCCRARVWGWSWGCEAVAEWLSERRLADALWLTDTLTV